MPKMKTHKGTKKRVRVTASGRLRHKRANAGHLMSGKSGKRCRTMRQSRVLKSAFARSMKLALAGAKV